MLLCCVVYVMWCRGLCGYAVWCGRVRSGAVGACVGFGMWWLDLVWSDLGWVNLDPHLDYTLGNGGRWVVNLSVLDRLVLEGLPLSLEVSVLQES